MLFRSDPLYVWILGVFGFIVWEVLYVYTCVAMYTMLGLILRKNSEW